MEASRVFRRTAEGLLARGASNLFMSNVLARVYDRPCTARVGTFVGNFEFRKRALGTRARGQPSQHRVFLG